MKCRSDKEIFLRRFDLAVFESLLIFFVQVEIKDIFAKKFVEIFKSAEDQKMTNQSVHAFAEKVALVTDGENPVGRSVALQLALLGSYVIVGFPENSSESRVSLEELRSLGTLANAVETDICNLEGTQKLVGEVDKMFGRLDLLINTLKFRPESSFLETGAELWDKTIGANLKSTFFVTQAAFPLLNARPKPRIVNIAYRFENNSLYAAAQSGLIGLTKSFAAEFPAKFRVNCVEVVEKSMPDSDLQESQLFRAKSGIAEDDVARAVVYLLSSEAVGLSGQTLTIS